MDNIDIINGTKLVELPFSATIWLNINCSLNENVGTKSTPNRNASFMKPLRLLRYNFTSFFDQFLASWAPPGRRMVTVFFIWLRIEMVLLHHLYVKICSCLFILEPTNLIRNLPKHIFDTFLSRRNHSTCQNQLPMYSKESEIYWHCTTSHVKTWKC